MNWSPWHTRRVLFCLAILVLLPILMAGATKVWPNLDLSIAYKYGIWALILADIFGVMIVAGHGLTGQFFGFLIDERNRMSSSRFQLVIWVLVVIPALIVFIYFNIAYGSPNATNIAIPPVLWVLLGISGGAAIGAPIVNDATNRSKGVLDENTDSAAASFADIFKGDETGNCGYLDISKVQMLLISIGLALGYGYGIAILLAQTTPALTSFPLIDSNLVVLLGISNGTYLGYKAAPHTGTKKT